jgi:hypothetical protein
MLPAHFSSQPCCMVSLMSADDILYTGCIKKNATSEFPKKSTLQFLSIKDFRPLGIEIELLIDHITVVVLLNKCINFALCTRVCIILTVVLF